MIMLGGRGERIAVMKGERKEGGKRRLRLGEGLRAEGGTAMVETKKRSLARKGKGGKGIIRRVERVEDG